MCIRIIRSHEEVEFEPTEPLEYQVRGAKEVVISYDPKDNRIQSFMDQMDRIVKSGVGCQMNIRVNSNHTLNSYRFERQIAQASYDLDLNKAIKILVNAHNETDKKLSEMQQLCLRGIE